MSSFRIVLVFVLVALVGVAVMPFLSLNFTPSSNGNSFTVSYSFVGMPPLTVEREVTSMIENELSQLEGIKRISSVSQYGNGYVQLEFDPDEDLQFRQQELYMLLRKIKLPQTVSRPVVRRQSADEDEPSPLLIYELRYPASEQHIDELVNAFIIPRLASMDQITEVQMAGLNRKIIEVKFQANRLQDYALSPVLLRQRILEQTQAIDLTTVEADGQIMGLSFRGSVQSINELKNVSLNKSLRLRDVATVEMGREQTRTLLRVNGGEAVFLSLYTTKEANRLQLAKEVGERVEEIRAELPKDVQLIVNYDDSLFLSRELQKASERALLALGVIALFGLLSYRSWRYLLLLGFSILINICFVSLVAYFVQLEIHLYTLAGLAISFGLVVDNSIVIIDEYKRGRRGKTFLAQVAASCTTIAALLVILFLPSDFRMNLTELVIVVSIALASSFLVSLWLIPALADLLSLRKEAGKSWKLRRRHVKIKNYYAILIQFLAHRKRWVIAFCIWSFGLPIFLLPSKMENWDGYNATIGSEFYQEEIRPNTDKWLGGGSRLFYRNVYERSSYRTPEKTRLYVNASLSFGHTLEQMDQTIRKVENYLNGFSEIDKFITRVHSGQNASISIEFKAPYEKGSFPYVLKNKLSQRSLDWGGVNWNVYGVGRGFSNSSGGSLPSYRVAIKGYDYQKIGLIADQMARELEKHKRIQEVNTNAQASWRGRSLKRYEYTPDADYYADFITNFRQLQPLTKQESPLAMIKMDEKLYPLYLDAQVSEDLSFYQAMNWSNLSSTGSSKFESVSSSVYREERQYIRTLSFDYYGSFRFGNEYLKKVIAEIKPQLPLGYDISKKEWSWTIQKEKRKYEMVLLSLLIIFVISIIFTENFRMAFMVVLVIPLSFVGLFFTFGWGDFYFDQGGYAAFLFLTGLSVNSILFILSDYYHFRNRKGLNRIIKAMTVKFWPITLTVLSTCLGFIPFLIHGQNEIFWFSLAVGTIGGLLVAYLFTFLVIPVLLAPNPPKK